MPCYFLTLPVLPPCPGLDWTGLDCATSLLFVLLLLLILGLRLVPDLAPMSFSLPSDLPCPPSFPEQYGEFLPHYDRTTLTASATVPPDSM
jgi:hypothetical protein